MQYRGSCHCGNVAFSVEGELKQALACNCSMCSRKGSLLWFVPRAQLEVQAPPDALTTYKFNKHVIDHCFCKTCGIHSFAFGRDPQGNEMAAINIRSLEGIDLDSIEVTSFDGRSVA